MQLCVEIRVNLSFMREAEFEMEKNELKDAVEHFGKVLVEEIKKLEPSISLADDRAIYEVKAMLLNAGMSIQDGLAEIQNGLDSRGTNSYSIMRYKDARGWQAYNSYWSSPSPYSSLFASVPSSNPSPYAQSFISMSSGGNPYSRFSSANDSYHSAGGAKSFFPPAPF